VRARACDKIDARSSESCRRYRRRHRRRRRHCDGQDAVKFAAEEREPSASRTGGRAERARAAALSEISHLA